MFKYLIFDIEVANTDVCELDNALKEVAFSAKKRMMGKTVYENVVWPYLPDEIDAIDNIKFGNASDDFIWSCFMSTTGDENYEETFNEFVVLRRLFEGTALLRYTTKIWIRANLDDTDLGLVYFDGSMSEAGCSGVAILVQDEHPDGIYDTYSGKRRGYRAVGTVITDHPTNNVGELNGLGYAIELTAEQRHKHWVIIGDSEYTLKCVREWRFAWAENNWKNAQGKTISNVDLIKYIVSQIEKIDDRTISFKWTRGHAGNPMNELCDQACKQLTGHKG